MIQAFRHDFERHRLLVEKALADLGDDQFFLKPGDAVNSIALIVKHVAGNLQSRWSNFLDSDGEKPNRNRDQEFVLSPTDTRDHLMAAWASAWKTVAQTLAGLVDDDLSRQVIIRDEPHTVLQALIRSATHTAYHAGQILYLARWLRPDAEWRTIPPGGSQQQGPGKYLRSS
jgi:uncharacterized damage-inducible protein DinB